MDAVARPELTHFNPKWIFAAHDMVVSLKKKEHGEIVSARSTNCPYKKGPGHLSFEFFFFLGKADGIACV